MIGDEDVARADVAVDEPDRLPLPVARLVRVVQPLRRLLRQRGRDLGRHRAALGSARMIADRSSPGRYSMLMKYLPSTSPSS